MFLYSGVMFNLEVLRAFPSDLELLMNEISSCVMCWFCWGGSTPRTVRSKLWCPLIFFSPWSFSEKHWSRKTSWSGKWRGVIVHVEQSALNTKSSKVSVVTFDPLYRHSFKSTIIQKMWWVAKLKTTATRKYFIFVYTVPVLILSVCFIY